jgi:hypothetical protein
MTEEQLLALAICATNETRPVCLHACAWCLHEARAELAAVAMMQALGQGEPAAREERSCHG